MLPCFSSYEKKLGKNRKKNCTIIQNFSRDVFSRNFFLAILNIKKMSKRQKISKCGFADVLVPIVYHIVPLLLAEECGTLRSVCKRLSQCVILSQQCPTPQGFLSVVADYQWWPTSIVVLQGGICTKGHMHITGTHKSQTNITFFDILFDDNECDISTVKGSSTMILPRREEIGTKPLDYIRGKIIDEFLQVLKRTSDGLRDYYRCGIAEKSIVFTCARHSRPCGNVRHGGVCYKSSE